MQPEVVEKLVGVREGIPRKDAKEVCHRTACSKIPIIIIISIGNSTCIRNKEKYKEKWTSNSQRFYKKGFQYLITREKGILLKSLQSYNQITTPNLILSQIDSIFSSTSSKILLFRSNQIAQKVAVVATF